MKSTLFRISGKIFLIVVAVVMFSQLLHPGLVWSKGDDYNKKLHKQLKDFKVKGIPDVKAYPGADAIIIMDLLNRRQFFGANSIWAMTYQDEIERIWIVVNPAVDRLKKIELELGQVGELDDAEVQIYTLDGEVKKIKKSSFTTSERVMGNKTCRIAVLDLPELATDAVIHLSAIIKHNKPLYMDYHVLGGPDPIVKSIYKVTLPEFQRGTPTALYRPCAYANPFAYRFRALDIVKKKFLSQETDKDSFYFVFNDIPAWTEKPNQLPQANSSSYVALIVNEVIVPDPLGSFKDEFENYMQIPIDTPEPFIMNAGSPEGYKITLESWDAVADFTYADTLIALRDSAKFGETAREVIGEQTIEGIKIKVLYDYLANEFSIVSDESKKPGVPDIQRLEQALSEKKASQLEMGYLLWGLLQQIGVNCSLGVCYSQERFLGTVDHNFPYPLDFNASLVVMGEGEAMKFYAAGDKAIPLGNVPPEFAGADILIVKLKPADDIKVSVVTKSDSKNPYIKVKEGFRVTTGLKAIDTGNPTLHKVVSKFDIVIDDNDAITLKGETVFGGFKQIEMRRELRGKSADEASEFAKNWLALRCPDLVINSMTVKNIDKHSSDLQFVFEGTPPLKVENDKINVPFAFFNESKILPVTAEQIPGPHYVFPFPFFIWDDFMITFEKGWQIESEPEKVQHSANEGMYAVNIRKTEIQFNYQRGFSVVQVYTPEQGLAGLRSYMGKIVELEKKDVLVLKRK